MCQSSRKAVLKTQSRICTLFFACIALQDARDGHVILFQPAATQHSKSDSRMCTTTTESIKREDPCTSGCSNTQETTTKDFNLRQGPVIDA
eukprot:6067424-Amphidinium_carterae.1